MSTKTDRTLIPLGEAAMRLRVPHRRAYDLCLTGKLGDAERRGGRLFVPADAVEALQASLTSAS